MLTNYFKTTFRNLWKHKSHTLINVLGLSLGITACLVIFLVLRFELSFDAFHPQADRIYRIVSTFPQQSTMRYQTGVPRPLPAAFRQDFSEEAEALIIEEYYNWNLAKVGEKTVELKETAYGGPTIAFTENAYFTFFNFPLLTGDADQVLRQPNEVIITQSVAEKLFPDIAAAMGSVINLDDSMDLKVAGVMADLPTNTDFPFEMLISYSTLGRNQTTDQQEWGSRSSSFQVFARLSENVTPAQIEGQLPSFLAKYAGEDNAEGVQMSLQPLADLHVSADFPNFRYRSIPRTLIWGMGLVGLLIILTACVNFINLSTALATQRAKEVGVRKVLGSTRGQLVTQFLAEAALMTLLATVLALVLTELSLTQLNKMSQYASVSLEFSTTMVLFLIGLVILVTLLAGLYPAWMLTRFQPVQALKNQISSRVNRRFSLREGLIVFQFGITQMLIIGTIAIAYQMHYIKTTPMGFDRDAVVVMKFQENTPQDLQRMRNGIAHYPGVENFSFSLSPAMSGDYWTSSFKIAGDTSEVDREALRLMTDEHYLATYGIKLIAGEGLVNSDTTNRFVVNEAFVRSLGYDSPEAILGTFMSFGGEQEFPITGVVQDYHAHSLEETIEPLVMSSNSNMFRRLNIKINMQQASSVIAHLEEVWKEVYPEAPFDYQFQDEMMAEFYQSYTQTFSLMQVFAGVSILIGCLGLYGLVTFMAERKTKEIGVRKVLGASVLNILAIFSQEFTKLILMAFVIAAPLAYFAMRGWLQNFAYKIDLGVGIFLWGMLATLIIALATVGYRSVRAALANPVDSLRSE